MLKNLYDTELDDYSDSTFVTFNILNFKNLKRLKRTTFDTESKNQTEQAI